MKNCDTETLDSFGAVEASAADGGDGSTSWVGSGDGTACDGASGAGSSGAGFSGDGSSGNGSSGDAASGDGASEVEGVGSSAANVRVGSAGAFGFGRRLRSFDAGACSCVG